MHVYPCLIIIQRAKEVKPLAQGHTVNGGKQIHLLYTQGLLDCCTLLREKGHSYKIILPTSARSLKKQESSRKTSTSALLTMPKPLTVWITTNWKILAEMVIPNHLTCLLRNLCAGQEATVRTRHGTTDWFQIGKGIRQDCILSP